MDACNYLADGDDFLFFYFELRSVICASSVLPLLPTSSVLPLLPAAVLTPALAEIGEIALLDMPF